MEKTLIIGIDTGKNTGIAIWNQSTSELEFVASTMIHRAFNTIIASKEEIKLVRVEDARLRKYITGGREKLQGVGSVKRDAKIFEDFLIDNGIPFELVAPKNNRTKLDSKTFAKITGWTGKTNIHGRDAAMLVFGWNK